MSWSGWLSIAALVTALVTAVSIMISAAHNTRSLQATQEQINLTEQGQFTDRFGRAVEQLGSDKPDIRLGGIYALERLARDSERDHPTIIEILTAFVRRHAPAPCPAASGKVSIDVQAALTVIARRDATHDVDPINLVKTCLRGANLAVRGGAEFSQADFSSADLTHAVLIDANFNQALLPEAHLDHAILTNARLTGAYLVSASLFRSRLEEARLSDAEMANVNLREADLGGATLVGADLVCAKLAGANSQHTNFTKAILTCADLTGTLMHGANFTDADLRDADLTDAQTDGAIFTRADMTDATGLNR